MRDIVILHNAYDKTSRDFVADNPDYQAIDWYGDEKSVAEYKALGLDHPRSFPMVVEISSRMISDCPDSVAAALSSFTETKARAMRDDLLKSSDLYMLSDFPITSANKTAMETYRQELRDVPEQEDFPETIEWPVHPNPTFL